MKIHRVPVGDGPIITPDMDARMGRNINGPSLLRAPNWLKDAPGRYLLYFADHGGKYIRLAYADALTGSWRTHEPGTLSLDQTPCIGHIASPDVHLDPDTREIRMYYHGPVPPAVDTCADLRRSLPMVGNQRSLLAVSTDGVRFNPVSQEVFGPSYFRVFRRQGAWFALAMPGLVYRSTDGRTNFEPGPRLFSQAMRHAAVVIRQGRLHVFYTQAGDCPESILHTEIDLTPDWRQWREGPSRVVLKPETPWEGADCPLEPSRRGGVHQPVRQLRDPCVFSDSDGTDWLLYAVAGEAGIALARIEWDA